jgi:hypothetical protein
MKKILSCAILFGVIAFPSLLAQNSFTNPVLYSISGASSSYSNNESGTTSFSGADNQKLLSVQSGTTVFKKVPIPPPVYRIERNSVSAQYTGATFYAEGSRITNGYNLITTQHTGSTGDDIMINIFKESVINSGEDNIFNNQTSSATFNNIERVDFIFPDGNLITNPGNQGFIISERGGNDNFKVVIVKTIDGSSRPTSYYNTIVSVTPSTSAWSQVRSNVQTYPFRVDPQNPSYANPVGTTPGMGQQTVYGIFYKFSDFGITAGTTVYGLSIAAGDAPSTASDWLNISNFPTNTNETMGGLDFTGVTGVYNQTATLSGTVYRDINGATGGINGTGINNADGTPLYVYLIDRNEKVYEKQQPAANGTYSFTVPAGTVFKVMVSTENLQIESDPPASSFTPASQWVNTGEQYGNNNSSGSGIDSVTNGIIEVTTSFSISSITNVNFGVQKRPILNNVNRSAMNPGGTITVQAPTLAGTDEDGTLGTGTSFKILSLPSNGTLKYNNVNVSLNQVITNYQAAQLAIDPLFDGPGTCEFTYTYTDAAGFEGEAGTATLNITGPLVNGRIYNDANGGTPDGTPIGSVSSQQLYAYLADVGNQVYEKAVIGTDGNYQFNLVNTNMNFTLIVSTENVNQGAQAPAAASLPVGWLVTQDVYGSNNGAGSGSDGNANLRVSVQVGTANVTGVNFGLNREPESNDNNGTYARDIGNQQDQQAPSLSGSDPEDGAKGTGSSFKITSLPGTGATLRYAGSNVTLGQVITNYDPASLLLRVASTYTTGAFIFTYASVDAAGAEDPSPATITMRFTRQTISGAVYHDADGTTGGVNGTASGNASGAQLYAYLVNASNVIIDRVEVAANGTWSFSTANRNTSYTVSISTDKREIGQTNVASAQLPASWVACGDSNAGTLDGSPNMQISLTMPVSNTNRTNVRFGYQQRPKANDANWTGLNPGGTTRVTVPTINGSDHEDGSKGSGSYLRIVTRPSNANLYYNNTLINSDNWNITSYNPALLQIDPTFSGSGTSTFTVAFRDNAQYFDSIPATVTMNFANMFVYGNVYHDANGLTDNTVSGTGINNPAGSQLYAYLVNASGNIVEKNTVKSDGYYSFINAAQSTAYTVRISTSNLSVGQSAPSSASLPAPWVAVGDAFGTNNGAGTGNDATSDMIVNVTTGTSNGVTGVNFGIQQAPSTNDITSNHANPGGTLRVRVPNLAGNDPEDGVKGSGNTFKITSLPGNATLYYNSSAVTLNQVISNYNSSLLELDPGFNGNGTVAFTYAAVDNANVADPTPNTVTMNFTSVSVSGTVLNDANGSTGGIAGTPINAINGSPIYAYVTNTSDVVLHKQTVNSSGQFAFSEVAESSNYNVLVSTTSVNVGQNAPASFSSSPGDWVAVGDDFGIGNAAGTGLDASANGKIAVNTTTQNVTSVLFGFNRRPETLSLTADYANPGGTATVLVPTLSGTDAEDGTLGSGKSFRIKTLPSNGNLYYNNTLVVSNQLISNYNPSLLKVDPTFNGYGVITFTYASVDAGSFEDLSPATVEIIIVAIYMRGRVFRDANGLKDNQINGIGLNSVAGSQLYAYLILPNGNVHERVALQSDGRYAFKKGNFNSNYSVRISLAVVNEGNQAPTSHNLPSSWSPVGDSYGINNAAGSGIKPGKPNHNIDATSTTFDIDVVYFGAQPRPVAHQKIYTEIDPQDFMSPSGNATFPYIMPLNAPAGTSDNPVNASVNPGKLSGFDDDDGKYAGQSGASSGLKLAITRLPDYNDAVLRYNNGAKAEILLVPNPTSSDPSYSYWNSTESQYEIESFDSDELDMLYKHNDQESVDFDYAWFDEADVQGDSELYSIEFIENNPLPVSLIEFTANQIGSNRVLLSWITATEMNSDFFEIQKSSDGKQFVNIGTRNAAGNSNGLLNYEFVDENANSHQLYYRLKMVDRDGSFAYSPIRVVTMPAQSFEFRIFPNPATSVLNLTWNDVEVSEIRIMTQTGQLITGLEVSGGTEAQISVEQLMPGVYTVQLLSAGNIYTERLIKK